MGNARPNLCRTSTSACHPGCARRLVRGLPLPRMLDLYLELWILRAPPERLDGPGRVGNQLRRVSGPSRYHLRGNSTPGYPSRRFQHAFNGCPSAGSEVEPVGRSEEHTSELQSRRDLVCRLLLEKKKKT